MSIYERGRGQGSFQFPLFCGSEQLSRGNRIEGPAVINQYDSTTVVPPGFTAEIDRFGNIVIRVDAAAGATDLINTGAVAGS